jgi:hypothetical protein
MEENNWLPSNPNPNPIQEEEEACIQNLDYIPVSAAHVVTGITCSRQVLDWTESE